MCSTYDYVCHYYKAIQDVVREIEIIINEIVKISSTAVINRFFLTRLT